MMIFATFKIMPATIRNFFGWWLLWFEWDSVRFWWLWLQHWPKWCHESTKGKLQFTTGSYRRIHIYGTTQRIVKRRQAVIENSARLSRTDSVHQRNSRIIQGTRRKRYVDWRSAPGVERSPVPVRNSPQVQAKVKGKCGTVQSSPRHTWEFLDWHRELYIDVRTGSIYRTGPLNAGYWSGKQLEYTSSGRQKCVLARYTTNERQYLG